jgi:GNAT superfamily N-acetyltransferase
MPRLRRATHADLDGMMAVGEVMWAETDHNILPLDTVRVRETFIDKIDHQFALVAEADGGRIVGVCTAFIACYWWSSTPVAFLQMWYVLPEHRQGLAGALMLRHYLRWAEEAGAGACYAFTTAGIHIDVTDSLLVRVGFDRVGSAYRRRL